MKFVEKKCPNCGANLKFNVDDKETKCKYCNSEFMIENNNESNKNVNLDKINLKFVKTFSIIHSIIFIVATIFILTTFVLVFINFSKMTGDFNTKNNTIEDEEIELSDVDDETVEKLSTTSKKEIKKWNGEENNYEDVGFYYLKSKVTVEVVYILKATYLIEDEEIEIYTAFSYYGNSINKLRYTPYISTGIYKFNTAKVIYGYDNIKDLYNEVIDSKKSLGFEIVPSNSLYID